MTAAINLFCEPKPTMDARAPAEPGPTFDSNLVTMDSGTETMDQP